MAIPVTCVCGAQLKAKDESAGKQRLCPNCRTSIAIPSNPPVTQEPEAVWQPLDLANVPSLSSAIPASRNPGKWIPIAMIGVITVAGGGFMLSNRGEKSKAVPPAAAPVKPVGKPGISAADVAPAQASEDRLRSLLTKAALAYAEDESQIAQSARGMIDECEKAGLALRNRPGITSRID